MYTYQGKEITDMRRAALRPIAADLGVSAEGSKDEIVARIVALAIDRKVLELAADPVVEIEPVKVAKAAPKKTAVKPVKKPAKAKKTQARRKK